eukprot:TRINITY_DN1721_c0_g1_i1.p1 TRINITY_DN1721_c0_g1~~TRINITY_DN1721_c0_g1_i1.p1  ORF type:complete len:358 (+),score=82.05 TRINITY_DN1721_c0_g1_i1:103-1074(+)
MTAEEMAIYDRQIRVWGVETQNKMRQSQVLVVGMRGLGAEVCKNLALAGIGSLTVMDWEMVTEQDLGANFLLSSTDIGKNRGEACVAALRQLNSNVSVAFEASQIEAKEAAFFHQFDVVCVTMASLSQLVALNEICRSGGKAIGFFYGEVFGLSGLFFQDLNQHQYLETIKKGDQEEVSAKSMSFVSLQRVLQCTASHLLRIVPKRLHNAANLFLSILVMLNYKQQNGHYANISQPVELQQLEEVKQKYLQENQLPPTALPDSLFQLVSQGAGHDLSPVCAIVGGLLAQEILKCVSGKDTPLKNTVVFNALDAESVILDIRPE